MYMTEEQFTDQAAYRTNCSVDIIRAGILIPITNPGVLGNNVVAMTDEEASRLARNIQEALTNKLLRQEF